jgi:hypothetical protein
MQKTRTSVWRSIVPLALAAALLVSAGACSNYTGRSTLIKQSVATGDYDKALEEIEQIGSGNSELLYLYEKGLVQHYAGDYAGSNLSFEDAEHLLAELYTKSVTRELASVAVTDNLTKYRGDPFEAVLVNYYQILNYLRLGDIDGALVECRQVNQKLQMIFDSEVSYFEDDPFLQYMTAMVYDMAGEATDAEVSYRVSVDGFEGLGERYRIFPPTLLYCDAENLARRLGDIEAEEVYARGNPCLDSGPPGKGYGRINLLLECGYVAHKKEVNIVLPIFKNDNWSDPNKFAVVLVGRRGVVVSSNRSVEYWLRIALPSFVPAPVPFDRADVRPRRRMAPEETGDDSSPEAEAVLITSQTDLVENVDALAEIAYREGEAKVLLRAAIRALIKYAAKKGADSQGEGWGALVNILGVVTESADTRAWSTLPEKILMSRLDLPAGEYDLGVDLYDHTGRRTGGFVIEGVTIREGAVDFLNVRVH